MDSHSKQLMDLIILALRKLFTELINFLLQWPVSSVKCVCRGSFIHHLGLDICFDENSYHDSKKKMYAWNRNMRKEF